MVNRLKLSKMKAQNIIYIIILSFLLITCEKVDSDVNMTFETLNGTWHLIGYMNADNTVLLAEPSDLRRPIIMHFEDNLDSGVMFGHTVVNCV